MYGLIDWMCGAIVPLVIIFVVCGVRKAGAKKTILATLLTLYLAKMLDIVGITAIQYWEWNPSWNLIPFSDFFEEGSLPLFQYVANAVMLMPLGVLLSVMWKSFRRLWAVCLAGFAVSLCIEMMQLFMRRVTATDDLLMNTLGAALGYGLAVCFGRKKWQKDENILRPGRDVGEFAAIAVLTLLSAMFLKYWLGSLVYSLPMFS